MKTSSETMETVAIVSKNRPTLPMQTPDDFCVIAIMSSYNEEDIIVPAIEQLHSDGINAT